MAKDGIGGHMVVYDEDGNVIDDYDLDLGRLDKRSVDVVHRYVVDVEESGHMEVVEEFPETGGKIEEWIVDTPESGHWETYGSDGLPIEEYDLVIPDDWPRENDIGDVWEYYVYIRYTDKEIAERKEAKDRSADESLMFNQTIRFAMMSVSSMDSTSMNDDEVSDVSSLFPLWDDDETGFQYSVGVTRKYRYKTYRCCGAHAKQDSWTPDVSPSLWYEISVAPDGILIWRQPTGAHDAPGYGKLRHYPDGDSPVYRSLIEGNTTVPGSDDRYWELV